MLKVMEDKSRGLTYSAVMKKEVDLCVWSHFEPQTTIVL